MEVQQEQEEEPAIQLIPVQQIVVELALNKHNIFLMGEAGSGKTATLREILRPLTARFRARQSAGKRIAKLPVFKFVAPTGIAALPLDGKTTFSFAGC